MRKAVITKAVIIIAASLVLLPFPQAFAHFPAAPLSAPDRFERAACRMVTQGGITKRVCDNGPAAKAGPAANANCPLVTKRIVKAGGEVVVKTRRQCS